MELLHTGQVTSRCSKATRPTASCSRQPGAHRPCVPGGKANLQNIAGGSHLYRRQFSLTFRARSQYPAYQALPTTQGASLFPAGQSQARVQLPALLLQVNASDLINSQRVQDDVDEAVGKGATGVILADAGAGDGALYEAAVKLKELLRRRAALLLLDRTDIAKFVEADGVVLTDKGVPTVIARGLLAGASTLVGRICNSAESSIKAAADGANFVIVTSLDGTVPPSGLLERAKSGQISGNPIPVLAGIRDAAEADRIPSLWNTPWFESMDGISVTLGALAETAATGCGGTAKPPPNGMGECAAAVMACLQGDTSGEACELLRADPEVVAAGSAAGSAIRKLLDPNKEALVQEEKVLLTAVLSMLEVVVPDLDELLLLRDALKALGDKFLVVVVGEFNSGKSSVINALLGKKFLAEGILPTTNEISILRYATSPELKDKMIQQQDGMFVRYLPAQLLEEMNIVDTPGTNVILERQQRLTEEYVPRADLVLFVMSADRPFSESEVRFLEYIRQWRKKVVFVVNKMDLLNGVAEEQQVKDFVSRNARSILKLDDPFVLGVSSRAALRAKEECSSSSDGGVLSSMDDARLGSSRDWASSGFPTFERFIFNFLVGGSGGRIGEGARLKLQTPLNVAEALMGAARDTLARNIQSVEGDIKALQVVRGQLQGFAVEMRRDGATQREALTRITGEVTRRADEFIDRELTLSNLPALASAVLGNSDASLALSSRFENEVVGGSYERLRTVVQEHSMWLRANCDNQLRYYQAFSNARRATVPKMSDPKRAAEEGDGAELNVTGKPPALSEPSEEGPGPEVSSLPSTKAVTAVTDFNVRGTGLLLEKEVNEALKGTASTALGAPGLGLLAGQFLPTTVEDLLAAALGLGVSYVALLNLPLRRSEIKQRVSKVAGNFASDVQSNMNDEVEGALSQAQIQVEQLIQPLEAAYKAELERLQDLEQQREELEVQLEALTRKVANMQ